MNGVFTRRQALKVERDLHALTTGPIRDFGHSDVFSGSILQHHRNGLVGCKKRNADEPHRGESSNPFNQLMPP
jgi:hypothetical protein